MIDFLRGGQKMKSVVDRAQQTNEVIAVTAVSHFELLAPAFHLRLKREEAVIKAFLGETRMLPLDQRAAEQAAQIMGSLLRIGRPINAVGVLISGISVSNNASKIVTSDRDFEQVEKVADLRTELI